MSYTMYRGCVRTEKGEGGQKKVSWPDAGYTLFVSLGDDGKERITLVDNRTGQRIHFFEIEQKNKPSGPGSDF